MGKVTLHLKLLSGVINDLECDSQDTIAEVKQKVMEQEGIPPAQQRIVFQGKNLADERTVESYNIPAEEILYFLLQLKGGQ